MILITKLKVNLSTLLGLIINIDFDKDSFNNLTFDTDTNTRKFNNFSINFKFKISIFHFPIT